ncbi:MULTISPECIES: glycosyltransferase [Rahnella]|uniref:Glycosyltransferase n=1 Tax=Rahnella laticis TaxID=2787622 RepID=A0ABS0E6C8_9GAMM|nr:MULTISPECIES: glycosyltransferase [Rahnella]MBF7980254.1 glycosyltransferase [Rahnella laticis]MBF8000487.1 glycosyltransferase [Rahnella sp. LAC-M12]
MRVIALQRESHVAMGVPSLSVSARITEVLEYLQFQGKLVYASVSESDPVSVQAVQWADVLLLSKHSSNQALSITREAKKNKVKVIYDIDDWIFSFPKYSAGSLQNIRLPIINEIISLADTVTVANEFLLDRVSSFIPNAVLVPNGMWVDKYSTREEILQRNYNTHKIVFTNADMIKMQSSKEMLFTALQVFFTKNKNYTLDFYGDPFPEMHSLPFLYFTNRMPYDSYMRALVSGEYEFSISPLGSSEDSDSVRFNECKNPFKYLNYGCAGVPGIYSNATIYKNSVKNRQTGIVIDNDYLCWLEALQLMASDLKLRKNIAIDAFDDVNNNYHIEKSAAALSDIIYGHI